MLTLSFVEFDPNRKFASPCARASILLTVLLRNGNAPVLCLVWCQSPV